MSAASNDIPSPSGAISPYS